MTSPWSRRAGLVAPLVLLLVLAGCSNTVGGKPSASSAGTTPSSGFPSDVATPTTPAPPPTTSPATSPGQDITDIAYSVPSGFELNPNFAEAVPLETDVQAKFFTPTGDSAGQDVITVLLYRLPETHLVDTRAQQVARIGAYNGKLKATLTHELVDTTVSGLPAFSEGVFQPPSFRYATWFVFGGAHLVQISCQVAKHSDAVATACQALIDSVVIT